MNEDRFSLAGIESSPTEIILRILSFINDRKTFENFFETNKRFNEILKDVLNQTNQFLKNEAEQRSDSTAEKKFIQEYIVGLDQYLFKNKEVLARLVSLYISKNRTVLIKWTDLFLLKNKNILFEEDELKEIFAHFSNDQITMFLYFATIFYDFVFCKLHKSIFDLDDASDIATQVEDLIGDDFFNKFVATNRTIKAKHWVSYLQ